MALVYGVLAALLVIFLLALVTSRKPKFGIGLSIVTVFLIILAIIFYSREDSRLETQKSRIPVEQIVLSDVSSTLSYGNTYQITGQLQNQSSRYMLASILLDIQVYDCAREKVTQDVENNTKVDKECVLLQSKQHKVDTRMPPESLKSLETYVLFDAVNGNKTTLKWDIKVLSGIGR
mgnify:FL=1